MRLAPLFAQCVMCFRSAEAQQGARAQVLNSGIVILLIPPVLVMAGIVWFAWRRDRLGRAASPKSRPPATVPAAHLSTQRTD